MTLHIFFTCLGLPHGPFWIHSRFFQQFIFVHFDNGKLVPEEVVLIDPQDKGFGIKGKLVNATFLQNPIKVRINGIGEHNCLQVIKTTELPEEEVNNQGGYKFLFLSLGTDLSCTVYFLKRC